MKTSKQNERMRARSYFLMSGFEFQLYFTGEAATVGFQDAILFFTRSLQLGPQQLKYDFSLSHSPLQLRRRRGTNGGGWRRCSLQLCSNSTIPLGILMENSQHRIESDALILQSLDRCGNSCCCHCLLMELTLLTTPPSSRFKRSGRTKFGFRVDPEGWIVSLISFPEWVCKERSAESCTYDRRPKIIGWFCEARRFWKQYTQFLTTSLPWFSLYCGWNRGQHSSSMQVGRHI